MAIGEGCRRSFLRDVVCGVQFLFDLLFDTHLRHLVDVIRAHSDLIHGVEEDTFEMMSFHSNITCRSIYKPIPVPKELKCKDAMVW